MNFSQNLTRRMPGLTRRWARSSLANRRSQTAEALRLFIDANQYLRSREQFQGARAVRRALRTLAIPEGSRAGDEVLSAVGLVARRTWDLEALADDVRGCDLLRLMALSCGLASLGSFRASAAVRSVARESLLEMSTRQQPEDNLLYVAALTDAGHVAEARSVLDGLGGSLKPGREVRSLALACGYSGDWVWRHWTPQPATRDLVGGSDVLLVGPAVPLTDLAETATRQSIIATFKYCGRRTAEVPSVRVHVSILNRHAYPELHRRFIDKRGAYTMSPCKLLIFKNTSPPSCDLGIPTERLEARPKLMLSKANLGLMAVTEILLAGAGALKVTGFDLWTKPTTAHPGYRFYSKDNRMHTSGGLDRGSIARSAGIHEPISQFNYLKRLLEFGRIDPDDTLRRVLATSEQEYAARLQQLHGFPFAEFDGDGRAESRDDELG